jgi:hypothetical protein
LSKVLSDEYDVQDTGRNLPIKKNRHLGTEEEEEDEDKACFAMMSLVDTPTGRKFLSDLEEGDTVLSGSGMAEPILGFLHRNRVEKTTMLRLTYSKDPDSDAPSWGTIELSRDHMLMRSTGTQTSAASFKVGDELSLSDGDVAKIESIDRIVVQGFAAPLTQSGTISVQGVAASCFVDAGPSHALSHFFLAPLRMKIILNTVFIAPTVDYIEIVWQILHQSRLSCSLSLPISLA